jgi:hypothetical protein
LRALRSTRDRPRFDWLLATFLVAVWSCSYGSPAAAASLSAKDIQVLGRAVAFLLPPPAIGATVAIAYAADNPASRKDAEDIAALVTDGLLAGNAKLRPRLIEVGGLATTDCTVVIAAEGANGPQLSAASRIAHVLCVTADLAAVRAGLCTMGIRSEPRVEIIVSHAASIAAGIEFAAAFRMMIREI